MAARLGLAQNFLDELSNFAGELKAGATDWLTRQYGALLQAPDTIQRNREMASALTGIVDAHALSTGLRGQVQSVLPTLDDLAARYPQVMQDVNAAHTIIREASAGVTPGAGTNIITAATGSAAAILHAQQFMAQLDDVDATLRSVIDQLIGLNVLTPNEAIALIHRPLRPASSTGMPWIAVGALVMLGLWWPGPKKRSRRRRRPR